MDYSNLTLLELCDMYSALINLMDLYMDCCMDDQSIYDEVLKDFEKVKEEINLRDTVFSLKTVQQYVAELYKERQYTKDIMTLTLGLCEEVGEAAKAVNVSFNPEYKLSAHSHSDTLEHELCDILVYLCGIANTAEIDLELQMKRKIKGDRNGKQMD